jgi:hypothetical protein
MLRGQRDEDHKEVGEIGVNTTYGVLLQIDLKENSSLDHYAILKIHIPSPLIWPYLLQMVLIVMDISE